MAFVDAVGRSSSVLKAVAPVLVAWASGDTLALPRWLSRGSAIGCAAWISGEMAQRSCGTGTARRRFK